MTSLDARARREGESVRGLTLLELFLSVVLSYSSNTTKHNRKLVMMSSPTRFWLGGAFFFFDCALIFCAIYRLTLVARAASSSPTKENIYRFSTHISQLSNQELLEHNCETNRSRIWVNNHILMSLPSNPDTARKTDENNNKVIAKLDIPSDCKLNLNLFAVRSICRCLRLSVFYSSLLIDPITLPSNNF